MLDCRFQQRSISDVKDEYLEQPVRFHQLHRQSGCHSPEEQEVKEHSLFSWTKVLKEGPEFPLGAWACKVQPETPTSRICSKSTWGGERQSCLLLADLWVGRSFKACHCPKLLLKMTHRPSCYNYYNSCCSCLVLQPSEWHTLYLQALSTKLPMRYKCLKRKKCCNPNRSHERYSQPWQMKNIHVFPEAEGFQRCEGPSTVKAQISAEEPAGICWHQKRPPTCVSW